MGCSRTRVNHSSIRGTSSAAGTCHAQQHRHCPRALLFIHGSCCDAHSQVEAEGMFAAQDMERMVDNVRAVTVDGIGGAGQSPRGQRSAAPALRRCGSR